MFIDSNANAGDLRKALRQKAEVKLEQTAKKVISAKIFLLQTRCGDREAWWHNANGWEEEPSIATTEYDLLVSGVSEYCFPVSVLI